MDHSSRCASVVYQEITDEYGYKQYGEFKVIVQKKTGYVNATKLCAMGGKRYVHWNETKGAKELLQVFKKTLILNQLKLYVEDVIILYLEPMSILNLFHTLPCG